MKNRNRKTNVQQTYKQSLHDDWDDLYLRSDFNWQTNLKRDPSGKLHLIRHETLIDGKRYPPDADVYILMRDAGILDNHDRRGNFITETLITPLAAAKFCVEDAIPEELVKFVHVHD
jgi:hypothetical protein